MLSEMQVAFLFGSFDGDSNIDLGDNHTTPLFRFIGFYLDTHPLHLRAGILYK
jgi:hypothetical protein